MSEHNHHDHSGMQHDKSHPTHAAPQKTASAHNHSMHDHGKHDSSDAFNPHAHHSTADFLKRFWICLALSVPVVALSEMFQQIAGYSLNFPYSNYVLLVLSTVIYIYGGKPFLVGAWNELKSRNTGMMTLIAVAITVAFVYSVAVTVGLLEGMDFFWELATLIVIMLLGHWLEMRSVTGASRALELLVRMMPEDAHLVHGEMVHDVKASTLKVNDVILIKPAEKIPADGLVESGNSYVNESMLTGESVPVNKTQGAKVIAGSINGEGSLHVRIAHSGEESYLNKVIQMVKAAQATKSQTQHIADRAARLLTFISIGVGLVTFAVWMIFKDTGFAVERMVTVMVTSCPHALGVAIPLVVAISTSKAAQNGLLIRNRTAFENARKITAIVFDKTGTLTKGEFGVTRLEALDNNITKDQLLEYAAAVEAQSQHPIAAGIVRKAKELNLQVPQIQNFKSITAKGVEATVDNQTIAVVSPNYIKEQRIDVPQSSFGTAAETVVFVTVNNALVGSIALADEIREDAKSAIETFKANGIKVFMATGDNKLVAESVSKSLGLDGFYAEVLPHQKVEIVKELQQQGHFVAMTGDGVNDAPALAQADVGIAVGSGTDVAAETADIVLVKSRPNDILHLLQFGKSTYRKMIQNLWWATGYNVVAIPLAAGVLYYYGIVLSPAMGAVLMSASTVFVAINAQLLNRKLKAA